MKVSGNGHHLITSLRIHHGIIINQIIQQATKTVWKWHTPALNGMIGTAKQNAITYVREGKKKRVLTFFVSIHFEIVWIE